MPSWPPPDAPDPTLGPSAQPPRAAGPYRRRDRVRRPRARLPRLPGRPRPRSSTSEAITTGAEPGRSRLRRQGPRRAGGSSTSAASPSCPSSGPGWVTTEAPRDEFRAWLDVIRAEVGLLRRGPKTRTSPITVVATRRRVAWATPPPTRTTWGTWGIAGSSSAISHRSGCTATDSIERQRWRDALGPSMVANVTGSALVELVPPAVQRAA